MPEEDYKRPESVLVLVYTTAGEVLLMERRQPDAYWQSVTGSLAWGEHATAAAAREVEEETGLCVADRLVDCGYENTFEILPAWRDRYAPDVRSNTEHVFRVEYTGRPEVRINLDEHRQFEWLPLPEALERASSRTNREAMRRFVKAN